jgi:hypothetical protein
MLPVQAIVKHASNHLELSISQFLFSVKLGKLLVGEITIIYARAQES